MDVFRTVVRTPLGNQLRHYLDALAVFAKAFWRTQQGNWAVVVDAAGYCDPVSHYLSLATVLTIFLLRHCLGTDRRVYAVRRAGW